MDAITGLLGGCSQVTLALSQSIAVAPVSFNGQKGMPVHIMLNTVSYNEINNIIINAIYLLRVHM